MPRVLLATGQSGNLKNWRENNVVSSRHEEGHIRRRLLIRCTLTSVRPCHKHARKIWSRKERSVRALDRHIHNMFTPSMLKSKTGEGGLEEAFTRIDFAEDGII